MAKVISIKSLGKQDCWNLHVDHPLHNYVLSNGIVSKNSHSYSYSILSYQEAWLKTYYPGEFMAALMTCEDDTEKLSSYIAESKTLGIKVLGPSINKSTEGFSFGSDGSLVFGLSSIKGLGKVALKAILNARIKPFKTFEDFIFKVDNQKVNKKAIECLINAGAFDELSYSRQYLLDSVENILEYIRDLSSYKERLSECEQRHKEVTTAKIRLDELDILMSNIPMKRKDKVTKDPNDQVRFDELRQERVMLNRIKPLTVPDEPVRPILTQQVKLPITLELLAKEKAVLGYYISIHPTDFVSGSGDTIHINEIHPGWSGIINGVIVSVKEIKAKSGLMAFLVLEDATGTVEAVCFSSIWATIKKDVVVDNILRVQFEADAGDSSPVKIKIKRARVIKMAIGE